jgi:transposase InsO family protein
MSEKWMSAAEIDALHLPQMPAGKNGVIRLAKREGWPSRARQGRGGGREYPVSALPQTARDALAKSQASEAAQAGRTAGRREVIREQIDATAKARTQEAGLAALPALTGGAKTRGEARLAAVAAFRQFKATTGRAASAAAELFAHAWEKGEIAVPAEVRAALPEFSGRSLLNWDAAAATEGAARLGGRYGQHRLGSGVIDSDADVRDFVLAMIAEYQDVQPKKVMRGLRARFDADRLPGYRTLQRWMREWRTKNAQLDLFINAPDAWRNAYKSAGGKADANILALNQRWEMDSTKADLLLADGGRHVIVGVIDVWSRRLKLLVSRSSSSAAVCSVLRRALLDWGVPQQIGTDNGSDYVSARVQAVLTGLDIAQDLAPVFTPEHKPFIERSFGTFNHDLMELLPGYVGHSVVERKRIESRKSFAQRMMDPEARIELRLNAEELQDFCDKWTEALYHHEAHSGLGGVTPFARAASWGGEIRRIENPRALDVLLAEPVSRDGLTVGKKGLTVGRRSYLSAALGPYIGQRVRALWDESDISRMVVFDDAGAFIAEAVCPELSDTGITRQELAVATKAVQKRALADAKKALKATSKRVDVSNIVGEILTGKAEAAGKLVHLPRAAAPHATAALTEAARVHAAPEAETVTPARATRRAQIAVEIQTPAPVVQLETPNERYARARALEAALAAGEAVPPEQAAWLGRYQQLPEYRARKNVEEDFRQKTA